MALVIPLEVSASPQTVPLYVGTPVEQVYNNDYEALVNKPQINGVTLIGNKSAADLGLVDADDYDPVDKTEAMTQPVGKGEDGKLYTAPAPSEDLFVAEYGTTTYAEIAAALSAGKACFMSDGGCLAVFSELGMGTRPGSLDYDNAYIFSATVDGSVNSYWCWQSGGWTLEFKTIGTYSKPSGGIPKTDLAAGVRTSLGKADTALQSVPNTYRTAAAQDEIDNAQDDALSEAFNRIEDIEDVIPSAASSSNQLADKAFVTDSITQGTAIYRGSFATKAALLAVAWQTSDPDAANYISNNDYAVVLADESQDGGCWRYIYVTGTGWTAQYQINESPLTQAQLDALNSGATAQIISSVADKLDKTGDGSNVTAAFSAASSRANIATGEKLSVLFGKIAKWLNDLGTAAFKNATSSVTQDSTDLVESGAVYTGLAAKYAKPSGGIPASDLAPGVVPTVPSAYTSNPAALGTASPGSSGSWARGDHVHPKPSAADIGAEPAVEVITVSGSTPSITAVAGKRYVCGEVSTLTIAVPASGIIDVIFESGTTATVLTITPETGHTVSWANGFDQTSLDASTKYELNIMDDLGVAASWT